jgi:hypothetical protein
MDTAIDEAIERSQRQRGWQRGQETRIDEAHHEQEQRGSVTASAKRRRHSSVTTVSIDVRVRAHDVRV